MRYSRHTPSDRVSNLGCSHSRRIALRAFTLVELLVVIGIIATLIALLLPALKRARDAANTVQCASNMHQITMAMIMWANDHQGQMPAGGGYTPYTLNSSGSIVAVQGDTDPNITNLADWMAWMRDKDPITGHISTVFNYNITYGGLTTYLGAKMINTGSDLDASNRVSERLDAIFRCPADNVAQRNSHADSSHGIDRYSYSMNSMYANPVPGYSPSHPYIGRQVVDGIFSGKLASIRNTGEKVLLVCEDEWTIRSGAFTPDATDWNTRGTNTSIDMVSSRHMSQQMSTRGVYVGNLNFNQDGVGNVGFCDGHVQLFGRKDALRARYSGNPVPDPVGF